MLKKILLLLSPLLSFSYLIDNQELKRQYRDYLTIFKKVERPFGFEAFVRNLNTVESFNKDNNGCKMYLTQYSDTFEKNHIYNTCTSKNNHLREQVRFSN